MFRELLRQPGFRLLYISSTARGIGSSLGSMSLSIYLFTITGSAMSLAWGLALMAVPWTIIGPLAGALADRFDRRRLVLLCQMAAAASLVIAAIGPYPVFLYLACIVTGCCAAAAMPAAAAMVPQVIERPLYGRAMSLWTITNHGVRSVGPVAAGWLLGAAGAPTAFLCAAGLLLLSGQLVMAVRLPGQVPAGRLHPMVVVTDVRQGFAWLLGHRTLRLLIVLFALIIPAETLPGLNTIVYLDRVLGLGPEYMGALLSMVAVGSIAGAAVGGVVPVKARRWLLVVAGTQSGLVLTGFLWLPGVLPLAVLLFLHGVGIGIVDVICGTYLMQMLPDRWRARAYSAVNAVCTLMVLGWTLGFGRLIEQAGAVTVFFLGGLLSAAAVLGFGMKWLVPRLGEERVMGETQSRA